MSAIVRKMTIDSCLPSVYGQTLSRVTASVHTGDDTVQPSTLVMDRVPPSESVLLGPGTTWDVTLTPRTE